MLTVFFIAWPLISMLLVYLAGEKNAKSAALGSTLVQFVATMYALYGFQQNADIQYLYQHEWIRSFGIQFYVGMDGISMMMVLLTNLIMPLIILSSWRYEYKNPRLFYVLTLLMHSALIGVFVSLDAFLYYIFWELALVPIYFIILIWGGESRIRITFKFFIYTIAGSLLMLLGIIFLYFQTQSPSNFTWDSFIATGKRLPEEVQTLVFWAFFIAYAIKMPVFPFHSWQPDTYQTAPPQGSMLLSGIMLKMGIYSVIRWILPIVPLGAMDASHIVIILAVTGIVYGAWIAIEQKDFKRLLAYSSFSHVGLIAAGIMTPSLQGLQGGMIQMLSHAINITGLFFVAQIIYDRMKTNDIDSLGGLIDKAPKLATFFVILVLASVALPLTNGFVGEFLLLSAVFQYQQILGAIAGLTIILSAVYMLRMYQRTMLGKANEYETFDDLHSSEFLVLLIITGLIFTIGVYPKPFLALTEPAMKALLSSINGASYLNY